MLDLNVLHHASGFLDIGYRGSDSRFKAVCFSVESDGRQPAGRKRRAIIAAGFVQPFGQIVVDNVKPPQDNGKSVDHRSLSFSLDVWTAVDLLANPLRMSLRIPGRAENGELTARAVGTVTTQPSPDMGSRPGQHQPPPVLQGIVHRRTDVLVFVVIHPPPQF